MDVLYAIVRRPLSDRPPLTARPIRSPPPARERRTPVSNLSSRGRAWQETRQRILERDGYTCGYDCGREATTVDHIVAKTNGGTDEDTNLIASCHPCNAKKGAKTLIRSNYLNKKWLDSL